MAQPLVEGNMEKVIKVYALMYQGMSATQMGQALRASRRCRGGRGDEVGRPRAQR